MVSKIVSGKSIRGILNYNENKVEQMEATLLMAAGFPRDPDGLSFKDKLQRFEMLTRQNEMSKTNAMHISLNFSARDNVDDGLMRKIAFEYMDGIGFGNQPFLLYRHYDAAHPHCHIATVNIANGGRRLETHNIGRNQSERTRKELEIRYGLTKAEDQTKEMAYLSPIKPKKMIAFIHSFQSEWLKRKGSLASWLVVCGAFFTPAILIAAKIVRHSSLAAASIAPNYWQSLWNSAWESMAIFLLPLGAILASSLITQIELPVGAK